MILVCVNCSYRVSFQFAGREGWPEHCGQAMINELDLHKPRKTKGRKDDEQPKTKGRPPR